MTSDDDRERAMREVMEAERRRQAEEAARRAIEAAKDARDGGHPGTDEHRGSVALYLAALLVRTRRT
jgi:hypothetical protein